MGLTKITNGSGRHVRAFPRNIDAVGLIDDHLRELGSDPVQLTEQRLKDSP